MRGRDQIRKRKNRGGKRVQSREKERIKEKNWDQRHKSDAVFNYFAVMKRPKKRKNAFLLKQ